MAGEQGVEGGEEMEVGVVGVEEEEEQCTLADPVAVEVVG